MSQPAIEVKDLSKVYRISHERASMKGTATLRDSIVEFMHKPVELFTGRQLKKEEFWALKNINFDVEQGDVIGIIGRNGSGKSTLLKVLSQIVDPTRGEVHMRGRVASLLEVGTGFHQELTGRENIFFNGAILGMKRKEILSKFDEIVAFSEVEQFLDTPVKYYSSGMYVKLAFAVAAHLDPDILIVDEVLAVGDAAFQKKSLGKMRDVAGQGRTVLFVSHNMSTVKSLCNKGILLDKGSIVFSGAIDDTAVEYMKLIERGAKIGKVRDLPRTPDVTGEAKIIDISLNNPGRHDEVIDSTKPMELVVDIESGSTLEKEVYVHCGFFASGEAIFTLSSEYTRSGFMLKKGKNRLTCAIEPSYLTGGMYSINCSLLFAGETGTHIDEVYDAMTFAADNLQAPSGKAYITQKDAIYFVNHKWTES